MKARFEPDADLTARPAATLVDPDAYDASEQQFAASLEEPPAQPGPRFVVEEEPPVAGVVTLSIHDADTGCVSEGQDSGETAPEGRKNADPGDPATSDALAEADRRSPVWLETTVADAVGMPASAASPPVQADLLPPEDTASWRQEVATRLNHYRARRRPRAPRYPSLRLKFEASGPSRSTDALAIEPSALATRQTVAIPEVHSVPTAPAETAWVETTAKIIEFPRSTAAPPRPLDELAEPVLDRPRILEAPELAPSPPALGGILMEPVEERASEKRPGFEMPLRSAPMGRRLGAAAIDAALVLAAFTAFAYIFSKIAAAVPPLQQAAGVSVILMGVFWAAYQYLLLVYTGTTPGLKLAKLRLSRFDGNPVPRRIRRWRVLVSVLSGVSLGLGYAWCFLDEDQLCWHDRITRTYLAPKG